MLTTRIHARATELVARALIPEDHERIAPALSGVDMDATLGMLIALHPSPSEGLERLFALIRSVSDYGGQLTHPALFVKFNVRGSDTVEWGLSDENETDRTTQRLITPADLASEERKAEALDAILASLLAHVGGSERLTLHDVEFAEILAAVSAARPADEAVHETARALLAV